MPTAKKGKGIASNEFIKLPERGGRCAKRSLECRREQENHSQKVCNANQIFQLYQGIDISTKKRSIKMPLCLAFGTGEGLLWYGICVPCSKRLPGVRDAFSEACRAKSSLLPHRTHLQCAKRPPRSLFAPAAPSLAPSTAIGTRNGPRSEVSRHKKETKVKAFDLFCRGTVTRTQDPLVPNQMR